jgi:hypothetical protein
MQIVRKLRASRQARILGIGAMAFFGVAALAIAAAKFDQAKPFQFDPAKTKLVNAGWVEGAGCPTNSSIDRAEPYGQPDPAVYTDPACPTGDPKDNGNEGLLLLKTGPTPNFAASGAELKNVKGITLTELGYDIREGSHCGAGAPRFNVTTSDGTTYFIGCATGTPTTTSSAFRRLRWKTGLPTGTVESISVLFDEGTDTTPGEAGEAIIDNIDVNGTLIGQGEHPHE